MRRVELVLDVRLEVALGLHDVTLMLDGKHQRVVRVVAVRRLDQACRSAANRVQEAVAAFPVERAGNVVELEAHVLPFEFRVRALAVDDELVAEVRALVVIQIGADGNRLPTPHRIGAVVGGGETEMTR